MLVGPFGASQGRGGGTVIEGFITWSALHFVAVMATTGKTPYRRDSMIPRVGVALVPRPVMGCLLARRASTRVYLMPKVT